MTLRKKKQSPKLIDLCGQKFGRWSVLSRDHSKKWVCFFCHCECGTERSVSSGNLRQGKTISCGCYNDENRVVANTTHGGRYLPEYQTWSSMKARCYNPQCERFPYYGGRGIKVCRRWLNDFGAFFSDMGAKPTPHHQIDRLDNDGDYSPKNCRWATEKQQAGNKSNNVWLNYGGKYMIATDAALASGIPYKTLMLRIYAKWPKEDIFLPVQTKKGFGRYKR